MIRTIDDIDTDETMTHKQAMKELKNHNMKPKDIECFYDELGVNEVYNYRAVFFWLGY